MIYPDIGAFEATVPVAGHRYLAMFLDSATDVRLPAELLAAICWRESEFGLTLTPRGPAGVGDFGNGLGLMQLDKRAHPDIAADVKWKDPRWNIDTGAHFLSFAVQKLRGDVWAATAAYNAGVGRIHRAWVDGKRREQFDQFTAHHSYATEVLKNACRWHRQANPDLDGCNCMLCEEIAFKEKHP